MKTRAALSLLFALFILPVLSLPALSDDTSDACKVLEKAVRQDFYTDGKAALAKWQRYVDLAKGAGKDNWGMQSAVRKFLGNISADDKALLAQYAKGNYTNRERVQAILAAAIAPIKLQGYPMTDCGDYDIDTYHAGIWDMYDYRNCSKENGKSDSEWYVNSTPPFIHRGGGVKIMKTRLPYLDRTIRLVDGPKGPEVHICEAASSDGNWPNYAQMCVKMSSEEIASRSDITVTEILARNGQPASVPANEDEYVAAKLKCPETQPTKQTITLVEPRSSEVRRGGSRGSRFIAVSGEGSQKAKAGSSGK